MIPYYALAAGFLTREVPVRARFRQEPARRQHEEVPDPARAADPARARRRGRAIRGDTRAGRAGVGNSATGRHHADRVGHVARTVRGPAPAACGWSSMQSGTGARSTPRARRRKLIRPAARAMRPARRRSRYAKMVLRRAARRHVCRQGGYVMEPVRLWGILSPLSALQAPHPPRRQPVPRRRDPRDRVAFPRTARRQRPASTASQLLTSSYEALLAGPGDRGHLHPAAQSPAR